MIYLVLGLVVLIGVGIILLRFDFEETGFAICLIAAICLFLTSIIWIVQYNNGFARIEEFKSRKQTIQEQRQISSEAERVMITKEIIDDNAWLAKKQYWNTTIFGDSIPDEIMELTPIK